MITPAVPELFEQDDVDTVEYRTESLNSVRELGPPDLVHLVKQPTKSSSKPFGVYHHVTGVDASSSASLAAYVNTLTYSLNEKNNKVVSGTYCCYNAFSRLDMRVQVAIPGSVESYCVDERGDRRMASEALWLETYLCSVLRAYSYADDGSGDAIRRIVGCRRFNPITTTESEHRFFEAAERLFFNGWQLGSDPEIQVPNLVSNHLTSGILNYISTTGRYTSGINLFEKLRERDPEIASLLAQVYISADEEVKAVRLLHDTIHNLPMDYSLLDAQAHFLNTKGRSDMALEIAKRGVISAPCEFRTWARLTEIYIGLENWDLAVLTLNSCPMFTYQDRDFPKMPASERLLLPIMPETICEDMDNTVDQDPEAIAPALRRLPATGFRGTFQKAYDLLTEITKKVGWDQLLKIRSQVFVMEDEYRSEAKGASRTASTTALNGVDASPALNGDDEPAVSKPSQTVISATAHPGTDGPEIEVDPSHKTYAAFKHKRLCERWFDNLFTVLYEDLRIFTVWRTEMNQAQSHQISYNKSAEEWEALADLAKRLHYDKEATEAWQQCLRQKFSTKAMQGLREQWEKEGNVRQVVSAMARQICWQYRWYSEFSPPLLRTVRRLIDEEGGVKIDSLVQATGLPKPVCDLTKQYASICNSFRSSGTER